MGEWITDAWEFVVQERAWFLSGLGLAFFGWLFWIISRALSWWLKPRPTVQVTFGFAAGRGYETTEHVSITLANPPEVGRALHIGNFLLRLNCGETIFTKADSVTGEPQQKRVLQQGNSMAYRISVRDLLEIGREASEYDCAVVEDAAGPPYRSTTKALRQTIAQLLRRNRKKK